jgi:ABC-type transport system substrate-binding protein
VGQAASGNVDNIVFTPIKAAATRSAALISGQVDMVVDPTGAGPGAHPARPQHQRSSRGRRTAPSSSASTSTATSWMGSNVKGKNPLKDKRVRQALYQAVDIAAIEKHRDARPGQAHRHHDRAHGQRLDQRAGRARRQVRRGTPPRSCWPTPATPTASS